MPRSRRIAPQVLLIVALAACGEQSTAPGADPAPAPAPAPVTDAAAHGRTAFAASCASCHASGDGFDLAFFQFADTTTIRRALKHVDASTARDIAAYVRSLGAGRSTSSQARIFQPGGAPLDSDVELGRTLFGVDAWPSDMTTARLRAIDPLQVRVAVPFPRWSVESDNTDWMPDAPLPGSVVADRDSAPVRAVAAYRQASTDANLSVAMAALLSAMGRRDSNGPCHFEGGGRLDPVECFQATRWASSLVAQHMLRNGVTRPMADSVLHDMWWDVGDAARRAINNGSMVANGQRNWTSWMYMAWIFGPDHHPSFYFLEGLQVVGLGRHAVWAGLRTMVSRPVGSALVYDDLANVARSGATSWLFEAERFGMRHLLERIRAGDMPPAAGMAAARAKVDLAAKTAGSRLGTAERDALATLAQQVLAALAGH
jgi:hypothetical protein